MPKTPKEILFTRKANKEAIDAEPIVDGQLLWNKETGETFMDRGSERIPVGRKGVQSINGKTGEDVKLTLADVPGDAAHRTLTDEQIQEFMDKLTVNRIAINGDTVTQLDAQGILANAQQYEGQYIEFLSNGDNPHKTAAFGFIVGGNGDNFLLTYNADGTVTQWGRDTYEKHLFEARSLINEPITDMDNLTIDVQGEAPYMASVRDAKNRPENTAEQGIVFIIAYAVDYQMQLYCDIETGKFYRRVVAGTADRHSFSKWDLLNGGGSGEKQVFTATITNEVGRLVCDMTAREIIDADRQGVVKAVYTDEASGETRTYYYFKEMPDGRAAFSKDGYIENGVPKQTLFYVDYKGDVEVETRSATSGGATKEYVDEQVATRQPKGDYATNTALEAVKTTADDAMPKSGGTFTGNVTGTYFAGTWFQTTSATVNDDLSDLAGIDPSGWIYRMSKQKLLDDAISPITRTEVVKSDNILPPDSVSGEWRGNVGEKPTAITSGSIVRTPVAIDISNINPNGSRTFFVSVSGPMASSTLVTVIGLDENGVITDKASSIKFPKTVYFSSKSVKVLVNLNQTQLGNRMEQVCLSAKNQYSPYIPGGKYTYVKPSSIDPDYRQNMVVGKEIPCFGDSIFGKEQGPTSVPALIAKATGANTYNLGFGGCKMSEVSNNFGAFTMCALAKAITTRDFSRQDAALSDPPAPYFGDTLKVLKSIDFSKIPACIIHYGTNDYGYPPKLDNPENPLDITTVIGALRYSIETLLGTYPQMLIYVSLPWYRTGGDKPNSQGFTIESMGEAMRKAAAEYGCPVIDTLHQSGVNKVNAASYQLDGLHPNDKGRERLAEVMGKTIAYGGY